VIFPTSIYSKAAEKALDPHRRGKGATQDEDPVENE